MSRGLGKVERAVLDRLERYDVAKRGSWCELPILAQLVYHVEWYTYQGEIHPHEDPPIGQRHTRSEYVATCRAVQKLARQGLVETKTRKTSLTERGSNRWLVVRLKR